MKTTRSSMNYSTSGSLTHNICVTKFLVSGDSSTSILHGLGHTFGICTSHLCETIRGDTALLVQECFLSIGSFLKLSSHIVFIRAMPLSY